MNPDREQHEYFKRLVEAGEQSGFLTRDEIQHLKHLPFDLARKFVSLLAGPIEVPEIRLRSAQGRIFRIYASDGRPGLNKNDKGEPAGIRYEELPA